jgi:hypothetical protein
MKSEPRNEYTTLFTKQRKEVSVEVKEAFLEALRLYLVNPGISPSGTMHSMVNMQGSEALM